MAITILPPRSSLGSELGRAFGSGIGRGLEELSRRRAEQRAYEEKLAVEFAVSQKKLKEQLAAQEKLMRIAHQQKMQQMAYERELQSQKNVIQHYNTPKKSTDAGLLCYSMPNVCIVIFVVLLGVVLAVKSKS